ncbi:hypothetical protein [Bifidobacterium asteroides]|uniref:Uncharacterized protein n=1 Tax=Bifidobacterium asteroides TaxID=1684 RepID=A0A318MJD6_9BIFI|nr:hypothetical protein [Bifidobacterium asteroides]PXY88293.1 hypothetical protein DKK74_03730 [Bifidobacterium asteroides]
MGTSEAQVKMNQHKRTFDANEKAGIKMAVTDLQWCLESFRVIQQDKWNRPILMIIELPFYMQVLVESFQLEQELLRKHGLGKMPLPHSKEAKNYELRMRHRLKLLDNTKFSIPTMEKELQTISDVFKNQFCMHPIKVLRRFQKDLGIYTINNRPVGSNLTVTFHLGYDNPEEIDSMHLYELCREYGADLRLTYSLFTGKTALPPSLNTADFNWAIECKDYCSEKYFRDRYATGLSTSRKRILFLVESAINNILFVAPRIEFDFHGTYFRKLVLIAYHSFRTIRQVIPQSTEESALASLKDLTVYSPVAELFNSKQGHILRNRCMHYLDTGKQINFDKPDPENCIVRSLFPDMKADVLEKEIYKSLLEISNFITYM